MMTWEDLEHGAAMTVEQDIRAALAAMPQETIGGRRIHPLQLLESITPGSQDHKAIVTLQAGAIDPALLEPMRRAVDARLCKIGAVRVILTAARPASALPAPASPGPHAAKAPQKPAAPDVRTIIAVASGKGGVGKSTTAVNLALALLQLGHSVGILDADIYGPSLPRLLGVSGRPESRDGVSIEPCEAYGLKAMSIGLMLEDPERPIIWRGPMVQSALMQMLRDVNWGVLDFLILDLPPGTGDVPLTLAQQTRLAGAVIVSTPQDLALIDARKGIGMFRKVNVPILGIIENMSVFICPQCGHAEHIFSHGGARAEAEKSGVAFLGEIPLALSIRAGSDAGKPVMADISQSPYAKAYKAAAQAMIRSLADQQSSQAADSTAGE